jgi:predicted nucleic acid-binding protein
LDSNVLVYAEGIGDADRCRAARELIARLPREAVLVPVQALGELQRVLIKKGARDPQAVRADVLAWSDAFETADSTVAALRGALDLSALHQMPIWGALILSVVADQQCRILLSEDFQHGSLWRGVTIIDPFRTPRHALLAALLA